MASPIFTRMFFASLAGSIVGAIIASSTLFWSIMAIDLTPPPGSGQQNINLFFGLFEFDYASLVTLVNQVLVVGIALGVAGAISWFESRLDGKPLGKHAGFFAGTSIVGSLIALILFIGISQAGVAPDVVNASFVKYIQAAYIVFATLTISYFASILQVRRVKDLGVLNG